MKASDELMLIPDEAGFKAWRAKGKSGVPVEVEEGKTTRGAGWVALPARCLVSVPMRLQATDSARRDAAAQLELEAAGLGADSLGPHGFDVQPVSTDERDQRAATFVQVASLPPGVLEDAADAQFAPSALFRNLKSGEVQIWREMGNLVLAIPHEHGGVLHCQALSSRHLDEDAAAEVRCILASLDLAGMAPPNLQSVCVIAEGDATDPVSSAFAQNLDLPVTLRREEPPHVPAQATRLVPAPVVQLRHDRQQRRMMLLSGLVFALVLVAALGAFAARVALRERSLIAEEKRLDSLETELQEIRAAQEQWQDMETAVTPDQFPVELFHQLVELLPPEGIRLTRFEIREDALVLDGEASSLNHGIQFRERLVSSPVFKDWGFAQGFGQPTSLPDGRATFRAEGRRETFAANEEESL